MLLRRGRQRRRRQPARARRAHAHRAADPRPPPRQAGRRGLRRAPARSRRPSRRPRVSSPPPGSARLTELHKVAHDGRRRAPRAARPSARSTCWARRCTRIHDLLRPAVSDRREERERGRPASRRRRRGGRQSTPTRSSAPSSSPRSTRATSSRSTSSTSSVHRGEIFGLLGPNGAGKTTTAGMLTTRVIPTERARVRRRHRRRRAPDRGQAGDRRRAADQHARPLARRLGEPLLPRPLLRDERQDARSRGRPPARAVPARRPRQGAGARALRRHGAAPHGGAGDHAPPVDPLPRRADRRPRSAEPHRAVGDPRRAARRRARRSSSPRTTWRRPTSSATGSRSSTTASCSRSTRRRRSSSSIGADTIVTVHGRRRPRRARPRCCATEIAGVDARRARRRHRRCSWCAARSGMLPAVVRRRRDATASTVTDLSVDRADARDRLHQPHREGPPRMTAVTDPRRTRPRSALDRSRAGGRGARRVPRAAPARPRRAAQDPQGVHPPHDAPAVPARLRVHVRVPEDRSGRRRLGRRRRPTFSTRARRRRRRARDHVPGHPVGRAADGAGVRLHARDRGPRARAAAGRRSSRSRRSICGRAQRPVRRAARVPDRRGRAGHAGAPRTSTGWCCSRSRRSPATCAARSGSRSAPASTRARCRCCSASSCCRSRSSARSTTRGRRSRRSGGCRSLVLVNPLVYMCEGFRAALTTGAAHEPVGGLPGDDRVLRACSPGSASPGSRAGRQLTAAVVTIRPGHGVSHLGMSCRVAATQVTFHGVRGSTPCDGHAVRRATAATRRASRSAREGHDPGVFDLGTGLRNYGDAARRRAAGVDGLPRHRAAHATCTGTTSRACRSSRRCTAGGGVVDVYGPQQDDGPLGEVFRGVMRPPYFPITPRPARGDGRVPRRRRRRLRGQRREGAVALGPPRRPDARVPGRAGRRLGRLPLRPRARARCPTTPTTSSPTRCSSSATASTCSSTTRSTPPSEYELKRHWGHCTVDYALHVAKRGGCPRRWRCSTTPDARRRRGRHASCATRSELLGRASTGPR